LAEAGAAVASPPPDAVTGAHVAITLLPAAAVANPVIFGDGVRGNGMPDRADLHADDTVIWTTTCRSRCLMVIM
jgi:3-hydroxyisobutyrate dehydrogenase-like beta-hydroxyacid dehydrogenase